jgi:hypothetical protein
MIHPRVVKHLKIDLIGVEEAEKSPESEEDRPFEPVGSEIGRLARIGAISYLDTIFHAINYTHTSARMENVEGERNLSMTAYYKFSPLALATLFSEPLV